MLKAGRGSVQARQAGVTAIDAGEIQEAGCKKVC